MVKLWIIKDGVLINDEAAPLTRFAMTGGYPNGMYRIQDGVLKHLLLPPPMKQISGSPLAMYVIKDGVLQNNFTPKNYFQEEITPFIFDNKLLSVKSFCFGPYPVFLNIYRTKLSRNVPLRGGDKIE